MRNRLMSLSFCNTFAYVLRFLLYAYCFESDAPRPLVSPFYVGNAGVGNSDRVMLCKHTLYYSRNLTERDSLG